MSKRLLSLLVLTVLLLGILNLLPTGRGDALNCGFHAYQFQKTYGFPLTYSKSRPAGNCNTVKYNFALDGLIVDVAIAMGVLGLEYTFLIRKRAKHA
ncbi:MAG TPA: hypothetical protein VK712_04155 [Verrucomicrobiae bacterium]|jgi:hypothetical protein|nr:hypothetical protein [Verrucomicrobiae bacterium]